MLKSRNNSITEDEMFRALSLRSNGLPENTCRDVYYGMVKMIVDQFRSGRDIILPGLGKLYVVQKKATKGLNIHTRMVEMRPARNDITFVGADSLKKYMNSIDLNFPN